MRPKIGSRIVVGASLLALACGGATEPLEVCDAPVTMAVSEGTAPTISWTPACGVERLVVRSSLPGAIGVGEEPVWVEYWIIRAGNRLIGPVVRYGIRPLGAAVESPAEQLLPGAPYDVFILNGTDTLGFARFTP